MIDKELYYESEESKYNPTSKIKDKEVRTFDIDNKMDYPYLMLEGEEIPIYRIQVIANTLVKKKFIQEETPQGFYNVYVKTQGSIIGLGMVHSDNLRNILQSSLYKSLDKYIMLTKDKRIEGEMMYSYCTSPLL